MMMTTIHWVPTVKYIDDSLVGGNLLSFNMGPMKQSFSAACNTCKRSTEISYCLLILTYATRTVKLAIKQSAELNAAWNSVYRKILVFHKWQSVSSFIHGIGRLDLHHYY